MALMKGNSELPLELRKVKALEGIEESLRLGFLDARKA